MKTEKLEQVALLLGAAAIGGLAFRCAGDIRRDNGDLVVGAGGEVGELGTVSLALRAGGQVVLLR